MTDDKAQFRTEGQPAFPVENKENENSSSSPEVKDDKETTTDQTGSPDQDNKQTDDKTGSDEEGLHNHPRWKEREEDWKTRFNDQETRHIEGMEKLREDLIGGKDGDQRKGETPTTVPSWFGGDETQWEEFQKYNNDLLNKAKDEARTGALQEITDKSKADQKAIDDATTFFTNEVTVIETDKEINPEGVKVDRNKLLKFVLDNDLVDSKGRWNYRAGWQMMKSGVSSKKTDTEERKHIADATTSEKGAETKNPAYRTSKDFLDPQNRPW